MLKLLFALTLLSQNTQARTLVITDSHGSGSFGSELAQLLEQKDQIDFYAYGGTKPIDWIEGNNLTWGYWEHHTGQLGKRGDNKNTPTLLDLLALHHPDTVIIEQGTNMVWHEQNDADRENIQFLITAVKGSGAKCIWIGPPDLNIVNNPQANINVEQNHLLLQQQTKALGCQLIESWTFTHYPEGKGDGIHYDLIPRKGAKLGKKWAIDVFSRIKYE